jgi:predicted secreted protein
MDWLGTAVVFAIVWWLILFMVLPFGAAPPNEVEPGMATSAPAKPRMALKLAITTLLAALVTVLIVWLMNSGLIQLRPRHSPTARLDRPQVDTISTCSINQICYIKIQR